MKAVTITSLLLMCLSTMASQRMYMNTHYCKSSLTLYETGRVDWYDCELDETFYGHYWQRNDTLFIETFCSLECNEDHRCFVPRMDICIMQSDTLMNVGYKKTTSDNSCYADSIYYFPSPHIYIRKGEMNLIK